jgi:uncharacterized protein (TIGR02001 family)
MRTPIIASVAVALAGALAVPAVAIAEEAAPAAAPAPFTGNFTLASEYIYRGIGQTNRKPAVQGGFDYAHASGLYVGAWGSNISWLSDLPGDISSSIELDIYGGYKGSFAGDFSYDLGVRWKWLSAKYSHTVSKHIFGWFGDNGEKTRGSGYLELNATFDLGDDWGLTGHAGRQRIKHFSDASYTDWKIGVTKDVGFGAIGLAYVDTTADGGAGEPYRNAHNKDLGKARLLLTFGKTF